MPSVIDKIISKLEEYDINLYQEYAYDKEKCHYFMVEDMVICLNKREKSLSISFKATSKPERVANNILILQEIPGINKDFEIMDSFIFNEKGTLLTGDVAYKEVEKCIGDDRVREYIISQQQLSFLLNSKNLGNC